MPNPGWPGIDELGIAAMPWLAFPVAVLIETKHRITMERQRCDQFINGWVAGVIRIKGAILGNAS